MPKAWDIQFHKLYSIFNQLTMCRPSSLKVLKGTLNGVYFVKKITLFSSCCSQISKMFGSFTLVCSRLEISTFYKYFPLKLQILIFIYAVKSWFKFSIRNGQQIPIFIFKYWNIAEYVENLQLEWKLDRNSGRCPSNSNAFCCTFLMQSYTNKPQNAFFIHLTRKC